MIPGKVHTRVTCGSEVRGDKVRQVACDRRSLRQPEYLATHLGAEEEPQGFHQVKE